MQWLRNQPLAVLLLGIGSLLMYAPLFYSARLEDWLYARTFFYHGTFFLIITGLLSIAFANRKLSNSAAVRLVDLFLAFILLPIPLAMPLDYLVPSIGFFDAYFEMLSSLTTTGATLFNDPSSIPEVLHLWRAIVGWAGGFLMLVVALGIFQPINLGGFEIYSSSKSGIYIEHRIKRADIRARMLKYSLTIFPLYFMLTAILAVMLIFGGERPLTALIHAMSTFATSGISNIGGVQNGASGLIGEALIFLFLIFAVSRFMYQQDRDGRGYQNLKKDKEINLMLIAVTIIPLLMFLRHWTGSIGVDSQDDIAGAVGALWGGAFMVMSFLTTTGFESSSWSVSQDWSGLGTSGIILMGLAVMGGGIATTAGGVKLMRIYALYKHGIREMQKLSFPNSVMGSGIKARKIRREGAYAAWIFFMLFLVSTAITMLLFSLTGISFQSALLLAISGLSTTGPLLSVAGETGLGYAEINGFAKGVFCIAMILGRLEALAVIAVLNPNFWSK